MKRTWRWGAVAIIVVLCGLLMSSTQGAYGEQGLMSLVGRLKAPSMVASLEAQSGVYGAQRSGIDVQSRDLQRQLALLEGQRTSLMSQEMLIPLRIQQERRIAEHQLQLDYYNVCLLAESGQLLSRRLELLDKQITVEETMLILGETTQNNVDLKQSLREAALQNQAANQARLDSAKASIELRIDTSGGYLPVFAVPEHIPDSKTMPVSDLRSRLVANNVSMKEYEYAVSDQLALRDSLRNIGGSGDSYYLEAAAQYALAVANRDTCRDQLYMLANSKHSEYVAAETQYAAMIASRQALMDQLSILDAMYAQGEISELDCLSGKYEVYKSLLEIKTAIVAKANLLSELDLLVNGIVLSAG